MLIKVDTEITCSDCTFMYPSGQEPIESIWKGEAYSKKKNYRVIGQLPSDQSSSNLRLPIGVRGNTGCASLPCDKAAMCPSVMDLISTKKSLNLHSLPTENAFH